MQSIVRQRAALVSVRLMRASTRGSSDVPSISIITSAPVRQVHVVAGKHRPASSVAVHRGEEHVNNEGDVQEATDTEKFPERNHQHCETCTCEEAPQEPSHSFCGHFEQEELPPPLPEPTYSVYKRVLPSTLTALSSRKGRKYLMEAISQNMAESYWALTEHFINQSDPAYCGVTTLVMVLNAMCVDPQVRWRGGWRYYGNEDVLLSRCCISPERVRRVGITLDEFALLTKCQGVHVTVRQPEGAQEQGDSAASLDQFRKDIMKMVQGPTDSDQAQDDSSGGMLVVSFARPALKQTGDGHFSPIAAYHKETDSALLLDVARFKYAPYWVAVKDLYDATKPLDPATNKPRGWVLMQPNRITQNEKDSTDEITGEQRRPVEIVPESGEGDICPVGKIKVEYCSARGDTKE